MKKTSRENLFSFNKSLNCFKFEVNESSVENLDGLLAVRSIDAGAEMKSQPSSSTLIHRGKYLIWKKDETIRLIRAYCEVLLQKNKSVLIPIVPILKCPELMDGVETQAEEQEFWTKVASIFASNYSNPSIVNANKMRKKWILIKSAISEIQKALVEKENDFSRVDRKLLKLNDPLGAIFETWDLLTSVKLDDDKILVKKRRKGLRNVLRFNDVFNLKSIQRESKHKEKSSSCVKKEILTEITEFVRREQSLEIVNEAYSLLRKMQIGDMDLQARYMLKLGDPSNARCFVSAQPEERMAILRVLG